MILTDVLYILSRMNEITENLLEVTYKNRKSQVMVKCFVSKYLTAV